MTAINELYGVINFDAYQVGDRLFDGIVIEVNLLKDVNDSLVVGPMKVSDDSAQYASQLDMSWIFEAVREDINDKIDELSESAKHDGMNLIELLEMEGKNAGQTPAQMLITLV